jgi:hypothetical protein
MVSRVSSPIATTAFMPRQLPAFQPNAEAAYLLKTALVASNLGLIYRYDGRTTETLAPRNDGPDRSSIRRERLRQPHRTGLT